MNSKYLEKIPRKQKSRIMNKYISQKVNKKQAQLTASATVVNGVQRVTLRAK